MTTDDELRARLAARDPLAAVPTDSPTADEIRERVMATIEQDSTTPTTPSRPAWRRPALVGGVAASVAALAVGGVLLLGGDSGTTKPAKQPTTLALTLPAGDVMASCVQFDVQFLKPMPIAFGGTVTEVGASSVTIDVDRWYKGGDADVVTLATGGSEQVALDGTEFTAGRRYLVTASEEGSVNGCGFSGPATPQLQQAYDEAFAG
jgi:hypothetical protein